jgi:DNA-binding transcriptional regulator LsrR (DeoR family)
VHIHKAVLLHKGKKMVVPKDKVRLIYKVAKAYYEDGLTYQEIGRRFGFSRMTVARLLDQARAERIVQIIITPPKDFNSDLERKLEAKYDLDEAVIVSPPGYDHSHVIQEIGPAVAECLLRYTQGREIMTMAWGTTLLAAVDAMPRRNWPEMTVVQMLGGLGSPEADVHGTDLARRMAEYLGAKPRLLPAPGIVSSKLVRDALLEDSQISSTLALAARADVALVSIGKLTPTSVVLKSGILNREELAQLHQLGAVGDIEFRFFDAEGHPVEHEINDRIIGLDLCQLKRIPRVIGAAGGDHKFEAIKAVLRGKLLNVLVTDDQTARRLLDQEASPLGVTDSQVVMPAS